MIYIAIRHYWLLEGILVFLLGISISPPRRSMLTLSGRSLHL